MELNIVGMKEFEEKTKKGKVLVDFYAAWCGPCSMLSPLVAKLADEHPEITIIKIDVDQASEIAAKFNVYSIPTLVLFEDGKAKKTQVGYLPEPSLRRFVEVE